MKKSIMILSLFLIVSCSSGDKTKSESDKTNQTAVVVQDGWSDANTYTVHVTGADIEEAKDRARYQILKDIVNVRMKNNSPYTDIKKIEDEFDSPLKNGIIIKRAKIAEGVDIYFQIRDEGLKEKFERK
jgi:hypothetical protein